MSVSRNWARLLVLAAAIFSMRASYGAPALTTIQDVLYKADGTRFNGTLYVTWTNFQSGNSTPIPTQSVVLTVVNGVFKAQLVPTTNASPGANYTVRYTSQGKFQFSEIWAVPPSALPLRIRDIRVSTGSVVGPQPPPVLTQLLISDISGLANELSLRPLKGAGFAPARTALINSSGQIDAAGGNPNDCVHVDGSSGPCGGGAGVFNSYADGEIPAGAVDGVNAAFGLQFAPAPSSSLALYRNGILLKQDLDYTLSGAGIVFTAGVVPQAGDILGAFYRYGDPSNPLGSFTAAQVICSGVGQSTSSTTLITLGSCTIPGGFLRPGDRIEIHFDYVHQGSSAAFAAQVNWAGSTIFARSGAASETTLSGRASSAIYTGGAQWNSESWGGSTSFAVTAGSASDSTDTPIAIRFWGQMTAAASDIMALRGYSVIRYPAQSNP